MGRPQHGLPHKLRRVFVLTNTGSYKAQCSLRRAFTQLQGGTDLEKPKQKWTESSDYLVYRGVLIGSYSALRLDVPPYSPVRKPPRQPQTV